MNNNLAATIDDKCEVMTSFRQTLILKSWIISVREVSYSPLADALLSF